MSYRRWFFENCAFKVLNFKESPAVIRRVSERLDSSEKFSKGSFAPLGLIGGKFFFPNGRSENKRFYMEKVWDNVLESEFTRQRLADLIMFGTIGHEERAVNEEDLREGRVSHLVSKLYKKNGVGFGEVIVLDTPAGRNLMAYFKSGSKLKISSRANGDFLEEKTSDGLEVIDPDRFFLETFDFVIYPGFPETDPQLDRESLKEDRNMNVNRRLKLRKEALDQRKAVARAKRQSELKKKSVVESRKASAPVSAKKPLTNEELLKRYKQLGTPSKIRRVIGEATAMLKKYGRIGTPADIRRTVAEATRALEAYVALGPITEVSRKVKGSGSKSLLKVEQELQAYRKLGPVAEVSKKLLVANDARKKLARIKHEERVEMYATRYGIPHDSVDRVLRKMHENDAVEVFKSISSAPRSSVHESADAPTVFKRRASSPAQSESLTDRYFARFQ